MRRNTKRPYTEIDAKDYVDMRIDAFEKSIEKSVEAIKETAAEFKKDTKETIAEIRKDAAEREERVNTTMKSQEERFDKTIQELRNTKKWLVGVFLAIILAFMPQIWGTIQFFLNAQQYATPPVITGADSP